MRCKRLSYTIMVTIGSMPGQMLLQQLRCIAHQIAVTNKLQHFHIIVVIPKGNSILRGDIPQGADPFHGFSHGRSSGHDLQQSIR